MREYYVKSREHTADVSGRAHDVSGRRQFQWPQDDRPLLHNIYL